MTPLVSIITPCFNGESFVGRFLESVLNQSYPSIEMILIDDGSTDRTKDVVLSYKTKFEAKGFTFHYLYQENGGQSSAINQGLKIFKGKYMTWPDSDDILPSNAIEHKVKYMESHPDIGLCLCKTKVVDEETGEEIKIMQRHYKQESENIFFDLINGTNIYYAPGGYMVRSAMFKAAMPSPLKIQTPRLIGQNYQLLLPIAYKHSCGFIDEILYIYTIRSNSHSHTTLSVEKKLQTFDVSEDVLSNIMYDIESNQQKVEQLLYIVRIHCMKKRLDFLELNRSNINIDKYIIKILNQGTLNKEFAKQIFRIKFTKLYKFTRNIRGL